VLLAEQRGTTIPEGWALDAEGRSTTDPTRGLLGAVLPFGTYKGSAIALLVEVFAGVLSGSRIMRDLPDLYRNLKDIPNLGHFFVAIDPARFIDHDLFLSRVDTVIALLRACPPAEGTEHVLLPGEIELTLEAERRRDGIPLSSDLQAVLQKVGQEHDMAAPCDNPRTPQRR
jgi:LDH2 family malate/lactate/ureidoglycolate dehydrogenase